MQPEPPRATGISGATDDTQAEQQQFVLAAFDRYEQRLNAYARRLCNGDPHAARDAVQHTFLQLCKQSPEAVRDKLAAWLYTVCRNRIFDERGSANANTDSLPEEIDTADGHDTDPAAQLERQDLLTRLQALIGRLPVAQRDVIDLWSHGFDAAEIAEIVKQKQGTVRVNLHRAIKRLQQHPDISIWLERATGPLESKDELSGEPPATGTTKIRPAWKGECTTNRTETGKPL